MKATLVIDDAVGETRRALLDEHERPFRLDLERWSERDRRPRVGDVWRVIVRAPAPGAMGWFVDLGAAGDGLIEAAKGLSLAEGAWTPAQVRAEARSGKRPVLVAVAPPGRVQPPDRPGRWTPAAKDGFLAGVEIGARIEGPRARGLLDAAIEEAGSRIIPLPGGGNISVEVTRGLIAVDVDAADRKTGEAGFALGLNREAAEETARQLALRGAGGPVVIDFLRMREAAQRGEITDGLKKALRSRIDGRPEVLGISPLGLTEAVLPHGRRPAADALAATPPEEREALAMLRAIEQAGWGHRGARLRARLSRAAADWLARDEIGWQSALAGRIGWRWTIERVERASPHPDVGIDA